MLDPKNEFIFKKLFVMAPTLLIALINAVRTEAVPIESIEILNPTITPEDITGKFIVLDILAKDAKVVDDNYLGRSATIILAGGSEERT